MLQTLPEEEYFSGLAELIKTGIIGNKKLFEVIENNHDRLIRRDTDLLTMLVSMAVNFKASIVSGDEKEKGQRRILNFGHTYGHAIELYKSFKHGYAVASGMELAVNFSCLKGYLPRDEGDRILNLLKSFKLLRRHEIPESQIGIFLRHDKKKSGDDLYFVFTQGIGKTTVEKIPIGDLIDFYKVNNTSR
jgi:3-dehydroquinate synthase